MSWWTWRKKAGLPQDEFYRAVRTLVNQPTTIEVRIDLAPRPATWTVADANAWAAFRSGDVWQKIEAMAQDSTLADLVRFTDGGTQGGADALKAYVAGRRVQMAYLEKLAAKSPPAEVKDDQETSMPAAFEEDGA